MTRDDESVTAYAIRAIQEEERERCAKVVEGLRGKKHWAQGIYETEIPPTREDFAAAIRAQTETGR